MSPEKSTYRLITVNAVCEMFGGITTMTLWRWLNNPDMNFPRPIYIGRQRFWRESELLDYIDRQPCETAGLVVEVEGAA